MPCVRDPKEATKSVGHDRGELNAIFQFDLQVALIFRSMALLTLSWLILIMAPVCKFGPKHWKLYEVKDIVEIWQTFMYANDGWNALYIKNHDQPRPVNPFPCSCPKPGDRVLQCWLPSLAVKLELYLYTKDKN